MSQEKSPKEWAEPNSWNKFDIGTPQVLWDGIQNIPGIEYEASCRIFANINSLGEYSNGGFCIKGDWLLQMMGLLESESSSDRKKFLQFFGSLISNDGKTDPHHNLTAEEEKLAAQIENREKEESGAPHMKFHSVVPVEEIFPEVLGDGGGLVRILNKIAPLWADSFQQKYRDYGETKNELGAAGQYADMHRKMGKLKRALWEGKELKGEQPEEILIDLIGHCFLTIDFLQQERNGNA